MINGTVIALNGPQLTGKPVIETTVANASGQQRSIPIQATVDTGFTGFLTLPLNTIVQLGLVFITNQPAELADGSVSHYDVYAGRITWHGEERLIPIFSVDSDPLVGMALLWNTRLPGDVVPDGAVTIVPISP